MRRYGLACALSAVLIGCQAPPSTIPGTRVKIDAAERQHVTVATTKATLAELDRFVLAGDAIGATRLVQSDRAFLVRGGDLALVIGQAHDVREIRLLTGESAGRSGWISRRLLTAN